MNWIKKIIAWIASFFRKEETVKEDVYVVGEVDRTKTNRWKYTGNAYRDFKKKPKK